MARPPQISDAEWEVMNVLWQSSPRTASDVADELCGRMKWHPKTVKTLLGRLVKKGALRYREEGNRYLYSPAFARERYVAEESRSFVDRVFGGHATPALLHIVETMDLSDEELEELRAILDRKQSEEGSK
ncbi:MAG TPA: BlaI/MecI/CopY family transcriptional regulator [Thermoanaerobaculia bacterium]|jgi:BlaI family penicillinase repressor|nr:BlaI/MecI/CopY family transcriptional regulator [Thermoanaerobaculia bacterium]